MVARRRGFFVCASRPFASVFSSTVITFVRRTTRTFCSEYNRIVLIIRDRRERTHVRPVRAAVIGRRKTFTNEIQRNNGNVLKTRAHATVSARVYTTLRPPQGPCRRVCGVNAERGGWKKIRERSIQIAGRILRSRWIVDATDAVLKDETPKIRAFLFTNGCVGVLVLELKFVSRRSAVRHQPYYRFKTIQYLVRTHTRTVDLKTGTACRFFTVQSDNKRPVFYLFLCGTRVEI